MSSPASPTPLARRSQLIHEAPPASSRRTSGDVTLAHEPQPRSWGESKMSGDHGIPAAPLKGDTGAANMFEREKEGISEAPPPAAGGDDDFPEGGLRAWLVVTGGLMCTLATFGFVNAWGAFQGYYETTLLRDETPSNIAWIGSLQYALTFMPSLVVGRLFDLGYFRMPMAIASAVLVVATLLVAECTQYWHFILCQGVAVGIAAGTIFGPAISVTSHWFKKKRGLALGVMAVGSSIGGTVFPIAFNRLLPLVGFKWTMRILAFILLAVLMVPNLTMRRRLPPTNVKGGLVNLKPFGKPGLFLWTLSGFVCFLGLYTLLTYIEPSAVFVGIPDDKAFYLISVANAASAIGRIGSGFAMDRFGALNVMIPMTAVAGALTYIWPFVHSYGGFVGLGIAYGLGSGTFVALLAAPTVALGEIGDVGRRVGTYMTILAFGALAGPPISGAIEAATNGFHAVGFYAGSMVMLGVLTMITLRRVVLGGWIGKF